jgi:hypothetical protein
MVRAFPDGFPRSIVGKIQESGTWFVLRLRGGRVPEYDLQNQGNSCINPLHLGEARAAYDEFPEGVGFDVA